MDLGCSARWRSPRTAVPSLSAVLAPRALLALLLLHRNEGGPVDRIVDELWAERPPKTAGQIVRVYVSNLRKALDPGSWSRMATATSSGPPPEVDADRFEALRAEGRRLLAAGEVTQAADALGEALSLWRGPALQGFADEGFAQPEIARLEELRLATLEDRFDAQLAAGRDSELVADLEQLVEANPLRERLRAQLMLALYRSGRQADALEAYQRGRRLLVDELGLEPARLYGGSRRESCSRIPSSTGRACRPRCGVAGRAAGALSPLAGGGRRGGARGHRCDRSLPGRRDNRTQPATARCRLVTHRARRRRPAQLSPTTSSTVDGCAPRPRTSVSGRGSSTAATP